MIVRYGGKKFDTADIWQHEENVGHYLSKTARERLVDKFILKWGSKEISDRVEARRNIKKKDKDLINLVLACFVKHCPYETGHGMLRGINYKASTGEITFQIGGWFAPYIIHLAEPYERWPTSVAGWTKNAANEANTVLQKVDPNKYVVETELGYGYQEFQLRDLTKIYDSTGGLLDDTVQ